MDSLISRFLDLMGNGEFVFFFFVTLSVLYLLRTEGVRFFRLLRAGELRGSVFKDPMKQWSWTAVVLLVLLILIVGERP